MADTPKKQSKRAKSQAKTSKSPGLDNPAAENEAAQPKKNGRPTDFTEELGDLICARLAGGESLKKITDEPAMPSREAVYRWIRIHQSFRDNYVRATEDRAEHMFDDMLEIADDGNPEDVQRARLRVDTRKWALSKMIPKKYGDKTALVGGDPDTDQPIQVDDSRAIARKIGLLLTGAISQHPE